MDIEKLIHCLQCCARVDAHNGGCDDCGLEYCGPECQQLCGTAATALSTLQANLEEMTQRNDENLGMCRIWERRYSELQAENESLKEKLYDGEGVNLVDYWMQQAKIEENGHRNCQAENEKLRADLEYEREHANAYYEECGQWEAENEKLRAELEKRLRG